MLLYSDSIKLTREYLDVVEQLHNAPKLYFNAVAEVVRRRIFSQALLIVSHYPRFHLLLTCKIKVVLYIKNQFLKF